MHVVTMWGSARGLWPFAQRLWPILFVAVVVFVVVIIVIVIVTVVSKGGCAHRNIPLIRGCWLL
jgi:hypothetical protein